SFLASPSFSGAQWLLKEERNVFSGETKQTATTENSKEHVLTIYRNSATDEIWANFTLPESLPEYISPKHPPHIRIDEGPPLEIIFEWYPKWFNLLLHSRERERRDQQDLIEKLKTGRILTIYYHSATGESFESVFQLNGASPIIERAISQ
ncbi:MAG: hypothetical protein OEV64_06810, partial [Desulfobulbaceae bacterium]|nr:hypothetical protein [Desulfobulbaceae bacterium]